MSTSFPLRVLSKLSVFCCVPNYNHQIEFNTQLQPITIYSTTIRYILKYRIKLGNDKCSTFRGITNGLLPFIKFQTPLFHTFLAFAIDLCFHLKFRNKKIKSYNSFQFFIDYISDNLLIILPAHLKTLHKIS